MLPWKEARDRVLSGVEPLSPVTLPVTEALGLAAAAPLIARWSMPPFDNSAMDGFAVRAADLREATPEHPAVLTVVAQVPAGHGDGVEIGPGEAARIMTGAPVPGGADAVVMVESTNFWDPDRHRARPSTGADREQVRVFQPVAEGDNIRHSGESVTSGSVVLDPGERIGSSEIGLLLSVGVSEVPVHPRPRVAVLSTGDELVPPGTSPGPGRIPDSNRPALLAALRDRGFPTLDLGLARDDEAELESRIRRGAAGADFLLTSGGVSVGDVDLTREVLGRMGRVEAYRVAVKPGKPQVFGHVEGTPVFGLPGNPVSSLVVFDVFVLPSLRRMAGFRTLFPRAFRARLAAPVRRKPGRVEFMRVRLQVENGEWTARSTGPQGSGILSSMTRADGYAMLPRDAEHLEAGSLVDCFLRGVE